MEIETNVLDSNAALLIMKTLTYLLISLDKILADCGFRGEIIEKIKNNSIMSFR